jgi:hypothetical protein
MLDPGQQGHEAKSTAMAKEGGVVAEGSTWWKQSSWFSQPSEALCVTGIETDDATKEVLTVSITTTYATIEPLPSPPTPTHLIP